MTKQEVEDFAVACVIAAGRVERTKLRGEDNERITANHVVADMTSLRSLVKTVERDYVRQCNDPTLAAEGPREAHAILVDRLERKIATLVQPYGFVVGRNDLHLDVYTDSARRLPLRGLR